eukprot:NODE_4393_length_1070_cov_71.061246_g4194_i0.p1 GENE.NODE_4393_length_1070_cov_71.061246_g4194_i0~~NODE_4393_length_1070_cov_71.061246_g4194_i0.p1  ORF type:complete len:322 (-),score=14.17 NODE_4393_length_1070_cov_71.061246_g4194_i0:96-1061(-)
MSTTHVLCVVVSTQSTWVVDMCNHGLNVTVHIDTVVEWPDLPTGNHSELYCSRMSSYVPVAIVLHPRTIGMLLCAHHRLVWKRHIAHYDWFLFNEYDMNFTLNHFHRLVADFHNLQGTRFFPGMLRYEESTTGELFLPDFPVNWVTVADSMFQVSGRWYMRPHNPHSGYFLLPKESLRAFTRKKSWYTAFIAKSLPKYAQGEHLVGMWMNRLGMIKATPMEDLLHYLIHHMTDRYIRNTSMPLWAVTTLYEAMGFRQQAETTTLESVWTPPESCFPFKLFYHHQDPPTKRPIAHVFKECANPLASGGELVGDIISRRSAGG